MVELIHKVHQLYKILLDIPRFTNDIQALVHKIQDEMKRSSNIISQSATSSIDHYNKILNAQGT